MALKEDYLDDILDTSANEKRKYRMINNADGTISLEDVTEYSQNGDNFGASDINITNKTVNELIAMGLNLRCDSQGYLEVKIGDFWEKTENKVIDIKTYLYNEGVFNSSLSEWETNGYMNRLTAEAGGISLPPTITLEDNTFILYINNTQNAGANGMYATKNAIDLSNYKSLNIIIDNFSRGNISNKIYFLAMNRLQQNYETEWQLARIDISSAGTYSLNIENVNDNCYICLAANAFTSDLSAIISSIWLE